MTMARPLHTNSSQPGSLATSGSQEVSSTSIVGNEKLGVLLLNLGGPETLEDVQPFLFNLFADSIGSFQFNHSFDSTVEKR